MATAQIADVRTRAHAKNHPPTSRRRLLTDWTRLLHRARDLRRRLPDPALDAAMAHWLAEGEALGIVLAATTRD